jgi:hypothetical protein
VAGGGERAAEDRAVIGYLHFASPQGLFAYQPTALRQGLGETGYVEGRNIAIEAMRSMGSKLGN